eukprot:SAG25_NODE_253_length_10959_cov_17.097330_8_plen_181_part_00
MLVVEQLVGGTWQRTKCVYRAALHRGVGDVRARAGLMCARASHVEAALPWVVRAVVQCLPLRHRCTTLASVGIFADALVLAPRERIVLIGWRATLRAFVRGVSTRARLVSAAAVGRRRSTGIEETAHVKGFPSSECDVPGILEVARDRVPCRAVLTVAAAGVAERGLPLCLWYALACSAS